MSTFLKDMERRKQIVIEQEELEEQINRAPEENLPQLWQNYFKLQAEKKHIDEKHNPKKRR